MMTTVRAANSVMQSVALVPRRVAEAPRVAEAQEAVLREAAVHVAEAILRENRTAVAVAPAVMTTMIITHRAAEAEAAEDRFLSQNRQNFQNLINLLGSNGSQPLAVATPN